MTSVFSRLLHVRGDIPQNCKVLSLLCGMSVGDIPTTRRRGAQIAGSPFGIPLAIVTPDGNMRGSSSVILVTSVTFSASVGTFAWFTRYTARHCTPPMKRTNMTAPCLLLIFYTNKASLLRVFTPYSSILHPQSPYDLTI